MGAFFYHSFIFLLACVDRWKVYNRLVFACTIKTAIKVKRQCAQHGTLVRLLRFSLSFLVECAASNRAKSAFKRTIIEDPHLTLAGIPFKTEANNSLIFLPLQTYGKNLPSFHSCSYL